MLELNFPDREHSVAVSLDATYNLKKVEVGLTPRKVKSEEIKQIEITPIDIEQQPAPSLNEVELENEIIRIKQKLSNILQIPVEIITVKLER